MYFNLRSTTRSKQHQGAVVYGSEIPNDVLDGTSIISINGENVTNYPTQDIKDLLAVPNENKLIIFRVL